MSTVLTRSLPIRGCTLSFEDLKLIYRILSEKAAEAAELEVRNWVKPEEVPVEQFEQAKNEIRRLFVITVTIQGRDGERLHGSDETLFSSSNVPEEIDTVYYSSSITHRAKRNFNPRNFSELLIDFRRPGLLDFTRPTSSPTPNESVLSLEGDSDTWVSAVLQRLQNLFTQRANHRIAIHKPNVYDGLLLVAGFPFSLYICYRLSDIVSNVFSKISYFLVGASYVYLFLLSLFIFRVAFNYTKWAFPVVELSGRPNGPSKHRKIWSALFITLAGSLIYDLIFRI